MDDDAIRRLITAIRVALSEEHRAAEIRVSLLPGMILIRINADPGLAWGETRSVVSTGE